MYAFCIGYGINVLNSHSYIQTIIVIIKWATHQLTILYVVIIRVISDGIQIQANKKLLRVNYVNGFLWPGIYTAKLRYFKLHVASLRMKNKERKQKNSVTENMIFEQQQSIILNVLFSHLLIAIVNAVLFCFIFSIWDNILKKNYSPLELLQKFWSFTLFYFSVRHTFLPSGIAGVFKNLKLFSTKKWKMRWRALFENNSVIRTAHVCDVWIWPRLHINIHTRQ